MSKLTVAASKSACGTEDAVEKTTANDDIRYPSPFNTYRNSPNRAFTINLNLLPPLSLKFLVNLVRQEIWRTFVNPNEHVRSAKETVDGDEVAEGDVDVDLDGAGLFDTECDAEGDSVGDPASDRDAEAEVEGAKVIEGLEDIENVGVVLVDEVLLAIGLVDGGEDNEGELVDDGVFDADGDAEEEADCEGVLDG